MPESLTETQRMMVEAHLKGRALYIEATQNVSLSVILLASTYTNIKVISKEILYNSANFHSI